MGRNVPLTQTPEPTSAVPSGIYAATIERIEERESKNGKLMFSMQFRLEEPESGMVHFELFVIGSDDDKTAEDPDTWTTKAGFGCRNFVKILRQCGGKLTDDLDDTIDACLGREVMLHLQQAVEPDVLKNGDSNPYAGDIRNKLRKVFAAGEKQPGYIEDGKGKKAPPKKAAPKRRKATRPTDEEAAEEKPRRRAREEEEEEERRPKKRQVSRYEDEEEEE